MNDREKKTPDERKAWLRQCAATEHASMAQCTPDYNSENTRAEAGRDAVIKNIREELAPSGVGRGRVCVCPGTRRPSHLGVTRGPSRAEPTASSPPFVAVEPYPVGHAYDQNPLSYLPYATLPYSTYRDTRRSPAKSDCSTNR